MRIKSMNGVNCEACKRAELIFVNIPADLSCTKKEKWKHVAIDYCVADIVRALQDRDINMRSSCCGHGKRIGNIHLQDGRVLLIMDYRTFDKYHDVINLIYTEGEVRKEE